MFLKNLTNTYQNFSYNNGANHKQIGPGETVTIVNATEEDETIKTLIAQGKVEVVDAPKKKKVAIPNVEVIDVAEDDEEEVMTVVHCPAVKKNGEVCNAVVSVANGDEDKIHFCGRHKKENPNDYEKVDGKWVKKTEEKTEEKEEEKEDVKESVSPLEALTEEIPEYDNE